MWNTNRACSSTSTITYGATLHTLTDAAEFNNKKISKNQRIIALHFLNPLLVLKYYSTAHQDKNGKKEMQDMVGAFYRWYT